MFGSFRPIGFDIFSVKFPSDKHVLFITLIYSNKELSILNTIDLMF